MTALYWFVLRLYVLFIFLVAVIMHEAGHALYSIHVLKKFPTYKVHKLNIGMTFDGLPSLKPIHKIGLYLSGILAGVPVIYFFTGAGPYFPIFILLYLVGCKRDLINLLINVKEVLNGKSTN